MIYGLFILGLVAGFCDFVLGRGTVFLLGALSFARGRH